MSAGESRSEHGEREEAGREDEVPGGQGETEKERLDRNLEELLQELRVALPGVQVLFAFLLTVPFTQAFPDLTEFQRQAYFGVLCLTAISTALLIAPSAFHRVLFRMGQRRRIVETSNKFTLLGLAVLACAMSGAVFLIAHVTFEEGFAIATGAVSIVMFASLWFALPRIIGTRTAGAHEGSGGKKGE